MSWWGILLVIFFGIVTLVVLLLMIRCRIIIEYGEDLKVYLKVLFLRFRLLPKKTKKLDPSDYRIAKLRKAQADDERKSEKKEKKKSDGKKGISFSELPKLIGVIRDIVGTLIKTFMGHLRIDVTRIRIVVATDDAAKTAITYGAVSQGLAGLLSVLENVTNVKYLGKSEVAVYPDFVSERFSADILISFSLRLWHLIHVLLKTALEYIKSKSKSK